ncbi:MAG: ATP-binding protein [Rhodobacteraceae bacterium]|nr:ATP-binding protein [Paracoccaceae bacterium]
MSYTDSFERFEQIGKNLPGFVYEFCLDLHGNFKIPYATEGIREITDIPLSRLAEDAGHAFDEIIPEDRAAFIASIHQSAQTLTQWVHEWRSNKNGKEQWYSGISTPVRRETGIHWFGYIQDITERKLNEIALSLIKEQERSLIQTMQEGIVIQDLTGKILSANKSAERILGLSYEQMIGLTSIDSRWQAITENGTPLAGENHPAMVTILTKKPISNFIMGVRKPFGELTWISVNTEILYHPLTKEAYQVFAVFHDITETKKFEQLLLESKAKAESAEKIKSAFLANMSHEIRTPLNAILGYTELLLDADHSKETKEQLSIIRNSGTLLLNIINDILDLSKIDAKQMHMQEQPFSLMELSKRVRETGEILVSKKKEKLNLEILFDDKLPRMILGDEYRLLQVILNLLNNAIKFTNSGHITVGFHLLEVSTLSILVEDTGIGIAPENFENIFKAFHQEDFSDSRKFGGTGLGLTISKKLIEAMGGSIHFASSTGEFDHGSIFRIILPFKQYSPESLTSKETITLPKQKKQNGKRILLAEDDLINQELARKILVSNGFEVTLAANGIEVIDFFSKGHFDLILMDVQMPFMTGLEATAGIRAKESERNDQRIPIIFLSAAALLEDQQRGKEIGGDAYLTKPLNKNELLSVIDSYLQV